MSLAEKNGLKQIIRFFFLMAILYKDLLELKFVFDCLHARLCSALSSILYLRAKAITYSLAAQVSLVVCSNQKCYRRNETAYIIVSTNCPSLLPCPKQIGEEV